MKTNLIIVIVVICVIAFFSSVYIVDETAQTVTTQFGKAIGEPKTEPGIYFKIPMIQKINYFHKNLLEWDGAPGEIPTNDKKYIWVDSFARWKITDPLLFFQTVNNVTQARGRLSEIINSSVRDFIARYPLIEAVRVTNRKFETSEIDTYEIREKRIVTQISMGREKIVEGIMDQVKPELKKFGIQIVDVAIKRLNYTEKVQNTVYARMIAEREQIAEKFRSEGVGEARKIEGNRGKELQKITSEAYRKAQEIKGRADAEATMIFASAYNKDPEFYSFLKTLDVYKNTLDENSSLVISTDSDFLKYLIKYQGNE
ncbi:MAG: protease modulator HflC [Deltaproteobacteria bacterium]|nr:protease modulator HflC [Deltaproteobacteria bacterium]